MGYDPDRWVYEMFVYLALLALCLIGTALAL